MNPRFPTSERYRRHPPQGHRPLRLLVVGLVVGGGLFFLFRSKTPNPVQTATQQTQEQEPVKRVTEPVPAVVQPEPKPESKPKSKAEAKAEAKRESKREAQSAPAAEVKRTSQPNKPEPPTASQPERPEIIHPEIPPTVRSGNQQEVKLDVKPETRSEIQAKKGDAKTAPPVKSQTETPSVAQPEGRKSPPLPRPKQGEEESATPPPPDALLPKLREQEMDLTFYKGLAMKKMVLPEEPTGKKIIPPFLAGVAPTASGTKKGEATHGPDKATPSTPQKPVANGLPSTTESKKSTTESQKPADGTAKKKSYQVQIAILSDLKNATSMAESLRNRGAANPRVSTLKYASGRTVFRVRIGPFATPSAAAKEGQRWQNPGQPAMVTAVEE